MSSLSSRTSQGLVVSLFILGSIRPWNIINLTLWKHFSGTEINIRLGPHVFPLFGEPSEQPANYLHAFSPPCPRGRKGERAYVWIEKKSLIRISSHLESSIHSSPWKGLKCPVIPSISNPVWNAFFFLSQCGCLPLSLELKKGGK
jgi:hypothetical protein